MAIEETIVIKTDTKSLAALKQEIKSIQAQLDLTPKGTKEYDNLVVKLRQAKGEIKDFKEQTKGLDPDQRASKLVNAFQGMTGAIQAAAGAITLFGGSSEDLKKVENNLLGIIAVGGGVQQTIAGFNDAADIIGPKFTKLGNFIKSGFQAGATGAQAFKSALAAIGIGAAIALVTALITNFEDLKSLFISSADAAKNWANESLKSFEKVKNAAVSSALEQAAQLEILTIKVNDTTQSEKNRARALKDLQKIYPELYGLTLKSANLQEKINSLYNKESEYLKDKAKYETTINQIAKNSAAILTNKIEQNGKIVELTQDQTNELVKQNKQLIIEANSLYTNIAIREDEKDVAQESAEIRAKSSEKVITAAEKEVIAITNAIAAKQRLYDRDITVFNKAKNEELEGAIDSAEKREGIEVKYAALEVERGKQLGNDLLQIVKDSEKRLVTADETVLTKRAEIQIQGNKIINQQNLESINAAIKQREDATAKSNKQIEENLRTALSNSERALEVEQSFYAQVVEGYRELTADNYEIIFGDQDVFYDDLVKRLKEYGIEVDRETAEQIRQKGLAIFKADEDAQLAQDQFYRQAIEQLRKNGEEGNIIADNLEKERKAKFDQNQLDKLASAVSFSQQEVDIAQNTADQILEIEKQLVSLQKQVFTDFAQLQSTLVQNQLDKELYALQKRSEARIKAAGDDAEAVERIEKDSQAMEDALREKAFNNEKQRKLDLARINTASAVLSILAETPKADFGIATGLLIAAALVTGATQIAAIKDTTYIPTYAEGGLVTGPGTNTSDSILARLSNGEFVVNAKSTQRFLPVLNTLNGTPNNNQLNQTIDSSGSSPMFRTYVLAGDVTSAQAAEARLNQKRKL